MHIPCLMLLRGGSQIPRDRPRCCKETKENKGPDLDVFKSQTQNLAGGNQNAFEPTLYSDSDVGSHMERRIKSVKKFVLAELATL